jgi:CHAT domain-containing protein
MARVLGLRQRADAGDPGRGDPGRGDPGRGDARIVLGDPRGNLAAAADEARRVAALLDTVAVIGSAADHAALAAARGAALLHVAAHSELLDDGAVLWLADGAVSTAEIAAIRPAPRLVVLASCGSAAARDEGSWGSLASAFLAAGSAAVVATQWPVDDAGARDLLLAFYQAGGATDPLAALGRVQAERAAATPARLWAAFTVVAAPPLPP